MNYEKNYNDYINYVKSLNRKKSDCMYYELHHIIPRSLKGTNDDGNLVLLTYREHYLAHFLLWKIYSNKEMMYSFWLMNNTKSKVKFNISSRLYESLKTSFIKAQEKKVICLETGRVFDSMKKASSFYDLTSADGIRISIKNKNSISAGYHWDYYYDNIDYTRDKFYKKQKNVYTVIRLEDVEKYLSYKEAGIDNNITGSTICDAATGRTKTANGYHWSKFDSLVDYTKNKFYKKERMSFPSGYKKVVCIETGKKYNSQQEAARDIGYKISGDIGRCCDGKLKSCGGFRWRRNEN